MIMGLLDSVLSVGGSLLGGWLNNEAADDRQNDAQNFSAQQFATRYQTTTKDMLAAGLNPMLAYTHGVGNSPTSSAASSSGYPDLGSSYNQSRLANFQEAMNSAQVANVQADTENKLKTNELIDAQIAHTYASAGQATSLTAQSDATTEKIKEETKNIPQEGLRLIAATHQLQEQASLMSQQSATQAEITRVQAQTLLNLRNQNLFTDQQIVKIALESKLLKLDVQSAEKFDNLARDAKQLSPILDILKLLATGRK